MTTLESRFRSKVDRRGPDECWKWTGYRFWDGYGGLRSDLAVGGGRLIRAHRLAYELLVGPIPDGMVIDHLCRNRWCVNPAHLEPVTVRENNLRGVSSAARLARRTHCDYGHLFDEANTRWYQKPGKKRPCRVCRACKRAVA